MRIIQPSKVLRNPTLWGRRSKGGVTNLKVTLLVSSKAWSPSLHLPQWSNDLFPSFCNLAYYCILQQFHLKVILFSILFNSFPHFYFLCKVTQVTNVCLYIVKTITVDKGHVLGGGGIFSKQKKDSIHQKRNSPSFILVFWKRKAMLYSAISRHFHLKIQNKILTKKSRVV